MGTRMNFGEALVELKAGGKVSRVGWNGKDMWLELQRPDKHSKMQRPYIFIEPGPGWRVPWVASQNDMLSDDWFVFQDAPKPLFHQASAVSGDVHVMPNFGAPHLESSGCWCGPKADPATLDRMKYAFTVWIHEVQS